MINDEELRRLLDDVQRSKHLTAQLRDLKNQQAYLQRNVEELSWIRDKEQADVDRLDGMSLSNLFFSLTGQKDERLRKEQQEAFAAVAKLEGAQRELEALTRELERVELEWRKLSGCEEACHELLRQRMEELKAAGGRDAGEILRLEERLAFLRGQKKELGEAIEAGQQARMTAEAVLSQLDSAQGWATWDVLGGGIVSDLAKYARMDDAQRGVELLQHQLSRFKTELADVTIQTDMQVSVDGFLRFADFFFDNIFTDWAVMNQIENARGQVGNTLRQIDQILAALQALDAEADNEAQKIQQRLENIVYQGLSKPGLLGK